MTLSETIKGLTQQYAATLNIPGAPGAGDFFDDDADLLPPGPENLKGRAAIQAFWSAATELYGEPKLITTEVTALPDAHARSAAMRRV